MPHRSLEAGIACRSLQQLLAGLSQNPANTGCVPMIVMMTVPAANTNATAANTMSFFFIEISYAADCQL
jgi:hypothetical protein